MIGDTPDIVARLRKLMPNSWFPAGASPLLDGMLTGIANTLSFVYSMLGYLRLQTRISTATDGHLDLIAGDFFGSSLFRAPNQTDDSFRARIIASILRERGTRKSVNDILTQLTGRAPIIFEPARPADTGAYDLPCLGYDVAGGYGAVDQPYTAYVTAYRPLGQGIPNVAGYGIPTGAYDTPSQAEYITLSMIQGITDADLYSAVNSVRPAGTTLWMKVTS